jgi:membrane-associated protease RseP (regulator of RpoE activity)
VLTVFLIYSIKVAFHRFPASEALHQCIGGPISVFHMIIQNSITIIDTLYFSALISIFVATTNILPIYPLDGGRIMHSFLRNKNACVAKIYRDATIMVFLAIIGLTFAVDIWKYVISAFMPLWQ